MRVGGRQAWVRDPGAALPLGRPHACPRIWTSGGALSQGLTHYHTLFNHFQRELRESVMLSLLTRGSSPTGERDVELEFTQEELNASPMLDDDSQHPKPVEYPVSNG